MNVTTLPVESAHPPRRAAPERAHQALNVASLLGAHAALVAYWVAVFAAPRGLGLTLLLLSPLASLLHQKALSEWLHEAAHSNFLASRAWNDRAIQALAGVFFFEEIQEHRRKHFRHHVKTGFFVPGDPDTELFATRTRGDLARGLARDLLGVTSVRAGMRQAGAGRPAGPSSGGRKRLAIAASALGYVAVTALLVRFGPPLAWVAVPVYLATLGTLYSAFNRVRILAQHVELGGDGGAVVVGSHASRTIRQDRGALLDRWLLNSRVMLFHFEHHLHPALPFRQLEALCQPSDDANRYATSRLGLVRRIYRGLPA